jgi:ATP-dependent DNA ligase
MRRPAPDFHIALRARDMALEGLVSKCRNRPYQARRPKYWVKVKYRKHPPMSRQI